MTRAFTLIELLAALVLASMLSLVLLTVTARINDGLAESEQLNLNTRPADQGFIAMLRHDLTHAQSVETVADDIVITGFGGLDRVTLRPTHRPVRVTYRLVRDANRATPPVLVREQFEFDNRTNRESWIELVAVGIESVRLRGAGGTGPATGDPSATGASSPPPLPWRFEVTYQWVDQQEVVTSVINRG